MLSAQVGRSLVDGDQGGHRGQDFVIPTPEGLGAQFDHGAVAQILPEQARGVAVQLGGTFADGHQAEVAVDVVALPGCGVAAILGVDDAAVDGLADVDHLEQGPVHFVDVQDGLGQVGVVVEAGREGQQPEHVLQAQAELVRGGRGHLGVAEVDQLLPPPFEQLGRDQAVVLLEVQGPEGRLDDLPHRPFRGELTAPVGLGEVKVCSPVALQSVGVARVAKVPGFLLPDPVGMLSGLSRGDVPGAVVAGVGVAFDHRGRLLEGRQEIAQGLAAGVVAFPGVEPVGLHQHGLIAYAESGQQVGKV